MAELQKTHLVVEKPELGIRYLADYMAGSERKKRAVLIAAKYRSLARLPQHIEAKAIISNALINGTANAAYLKERAKFVREKMATSDFEVFVNETNADFLNRFSEVAEGLNLPGVEFLPGKTYTLKSVNGLKVPFRTNLSLRRVTRTNKVKVGALMIRYQKGKALASAVGEYQGSAICGFLKECGVEDGAEVDRELCGVLDAQSGLVQLAPSSCVTSFKNTQAACATIADAWPNLKPPPGAVI